jgi:choline dehydrogenase-like flavoprotein
LHPFSRGHIHITGPSLDDVPDFEVGFFSDDGIDIKKHLWMYKKQREIARRMSLFQGEVASWHPQFSSGSKAACVETPDGVELGQIEYSEADDKVILEWLRKNVNTTWHSMGTCKMAPLERDGVVDSFLNVHGTQGLKIADMSIAPSNVSSHPNSTAMAIGEKAADIILRELGLAGK